MTLALATLQNISVSPAPEAVEVQFNPTEYGVDRGVTYAELQVPGLQMPLLQFVRGDAQTLTLELFLDGTDKRQSAAPDKTVEGRLAALRTFVTVQSELHAPPVCLFTWGDVHFTGVVTQLRERYTLFSETGAVLRARVTTTFKSYQAPEVQLRGMALHSPDRTRVRVLREGETLAQLAREAYGDPRLWRAIARENDIERPRFVPPGTALRIPAL
ncbi:MAG: peptidoglycan-binding protein [Gemmatimonadaceae bacterium]|nr:peptidoglycan-binding protein [Gemmatimonadaceae bacterium]NUQ92462.1 peptidoglycan-binding protein [Gemmatimonadaceae bacterium]NUR20752.1 peptidoglycan-binding protein [Gemmatimonadaceae bacterium]NUS98596.1 peptidoglycan-binding protein [Gemmatimonadaceae bacterium]